VRRTAAAPAGKTPTGSPGTPCSQARRPATICRRQTIPRHTTQKQQFEVLIHYAHHPRVGERVLVVRTVHHSGLLHFVVDSADGTRCLLPEWMTLLSAARLPIVETATVSIAALRALRATIDNCNLSSATSSNTREMGSHVDTTPRPPTRSAVSGSTVHESRKVTAGGSSGSSCSVKATSRRVRSGSDEDEVGR
jgi:hypothetical protein